MAQRRRTGRRPAGGDGGGGGHDTGGSGRWMVSYMDMVTVLMCLFIVLFAISSVDQGKYQELRSSLAAGFGTVADADVVDAQVENPTDEPPETETDLDRAVAEVDDLTALRDAMSRDLADQGLSDAVRFRIDERGLTVRLVSADTFFSSASADLTADARQVLRVVGPALEPTTYQIMVEGNADEKKLYGSVYPTNWELSAARATAVLRQLVATAGVEVERIAAVGFGSARPLAEGRDAKALAANRRVDVMVLSSQPEAVRSLIPSALAQRRGEGTGGSEGAESAGRAEGTGGGEPAS